MSTTELEGPRVWLITGTSSGLGFNLVEAVLAAGERVIATLRKPEVLASLSAQYSTDKLLVLELDVVQDSHVLSVFQKAKTHFGRVDVVVNNAGYGLFGEIEGTTDEQARHQMEVNFWGPVRICREAVRFFREENPAGVDGRILNVSSTGGFSANPTLAFYSASKFALEGFSESLSKELPPSWNIKVTIIQPGGFRTQWNKGSMVILPPHPAYTGPDAPSAKFRPLVTSHEYQGDPVKAAKAFIAISKASNPPLRLALGPDALHIVRFKCGAILKDMEEWQELSSSTVVDDGDSDNFIAKLAPATVRK